MTVLERLGPDHLRAAVARYADVLQGHREAINRLNVYPVPDGDTGTNMALTMASVVEALHGADPGMAATCQAISHGSLMGARGNSGVILSQVLRGLAAELGPLDAVDGPALARALTAASTAAYGAVGRPVEGTILTVVRAAAEGATAGAAAGDDLEGVLDAADAAAAAALAATPGQLPALKAAGVVDAGGAGFVLLLDALLHVAADRPLPPPPDPATVPGVAGHQDGGPAHGSDPHAHGRDDVIADLRYEVMYLLEAPDHAIPAFKEVWAGIGDSIVVVGGDGLWNCHIHTDDVGAAVEAALDCGRPRRIRVADLLDQVVEERWVREAVPVPQATSPHVPTAVVAVAAGDGVRRILRSLGVQVVVTGGQTMNPSTAQLLEAVDSVDCDEVVLLPNNKDIVPVAEQVVGLAARPVRVVATRGVAEGFAALMSYDPQAGADRNAAAMAEAAGTVTTAEVTRAVRDGTWSGGDFPPGRWLGMAGGAIRSVGTTVVEATIGVLDELLEGDREVVTLIEGEGSRPADTREVREWLGARHPGVEVEVHHGGQPIWAYLLSVE